jgi:hypothetical protein
MSCLAEATFAVMHTAAKVKSSQYWQLAHPTWLVRSSLLLPRSSCALMRAAGVQEQLQLRARASSCCTCIQTTPGNSCVQMHMSHRHETVYSPMVPGPYSCRTLASEKAALSIVLERRLRVQAAGCNMRT